MSKERERERKKWKFDELRNGVSKESNQTMCLMNKLHSLLLLGLLMDSLGVYKLSFLYYVQSVNIYI